MVQIDMEMPATCWECPFGLPRLTGNHFVICMVPGCNRLMTAQDAKEKRAKNCPLINTGEEFEWCHDCKEYDAERHCCPRWTKVIRKTVEDLKRARPKGEWEALTASEVCGWNPEFAGRDPVFLHRCSICKHDVYVNEFGEEILSDFCPFCGADMREFADDIS